MGGLLARSTLAVDRGSGHGLWPSGSKHRVSRDVDGLLADLHHTAHHDIVDDRRIDAVAVLEGLQRLRREVNWVPVL